MLPTSRWLRCLSARLLSVILLALTPLASASPPDASWIEGIYDEADRDDDLVAASSLEAVVQQLQIVEERARLVVRYAPLELPTISTAGVGKSQSRAPPAPKLAVQP
jgi:hypothetical protein